MSKVINLMLNSNNNPIKDNSIHKVAASTTFLSRNVGDSNDDIINTIRSAIISGLYYIPDFGIVLGWLISTL